MNGKELAAVLLAVALLGAIYIFLNPAPDLPPENDGYSAPFLLGPNSSIELFAQNLLYAEKVCIVEDLRGLEAYPLSRNNVMQCAIDFSGSSGLAGKELEVYALGGEACTTRAGVRPIEDCYAEITSFSEDSSASVIWIEKGNESVAYTKDILVQVNEQYLQGTCSARVNAPEVVSEPEEDVGDETTTPPEEGGLEAQEEEPPAQPAESGETPLENTTGEADSAPPENEGASNTFP